MKIIKIALIFFILCFFPCEGFCAAFLIYNQDAKANGMGMAVSASIDNASSVFYNPALLIEQTGSGLTFGDIIAYPKMSYEQPVTSKRYYTKTEAHHIPHIYGKYSTKDIAFGIGVFSPFGLSTEWSRSWPGRYSIVFAEIKTTFINPAFAFKINDHVNLGLGVSYVKSSVAFKSALNIFPLPDGTSKLTGDGEGIGLNGGVLVKLPGDFSVSATFRSPVNLEFKGKAKFFLPTPLAPVQTGASTKLTLPFLFASGVVKRFNRFLLEADVLFTGWSCMNSYRIKSDNKMADGFYYKNWHSTVTLASGVNYIINKNHEIRFGYMYDMTPIPKSTLGPELPDNTRHIFTSGYSFKKSPSRLNIGYQATFFEKRPSYLKGLNGRYSGFAHLLLFGVDYGI